MEISFQHNLKELTKNIEDQYQRQIPFATYLALQNTAEQINKNIRTEIVRIFNNPTKQVIKSVQLQITPPRFKKTPLSNMAVKFNIDDTGSGGRNLSIAESLEAEVVGGKRKYKRSETHFKSKGILKSGDMIVAGNAYLNAHGNISGGKMVQIISGVAGFDESTFRRRTKMNISEKSKSKNKSRSNYFVIKNKHGRLPAGVYERRGTKIIPALLFIKTANYKQRWKFQDYIQDQFDKNFNQQFENSFAYAVKTDRK